jgi:phage gpG-like protein
VAGAVQIDGAAELDRSLAQLQRELGDLSPLHRQIASDLAQRIAAVAPRDTGRLAGSFQGSGEPDKAEVSSDLDYAGVQNYGAPAHNIAGTHYAENALAASAAGIESAYRAGVEKLLRKAES